MGQGAAMQLSNEEILEELMGSVKLKPGIMGDLMSRILTNKMPKAQVTAALVLMRAKGARELELGEAAKTALSMAEMRERPDYEIGDIVGTGGDGQNTINVSTMASLTVASIGMPVAKHGHVSVSSKCGAADVLEQLGLSLGLSRTLARRSLDNFGWTFLFAPNFHPSFKAVKEIRSELKIKTIFNILGPLVNPWAPDIMVLGVYDPDLIDPYIEALKFLGRSKALVVHGSGLDEVALHGPTTCALLMDGSIDRFTIKPDYLGLKEASLESIRGGSPQENARDVENILKGDGTEAKTSMVAAGAGALLWLGSHATNWKNGVEMAMTAQREGKPFELLQRIRKLHHGA